MKKLFLIISLISVATLYRPASAQVSVNINIGAQPVWGPVGYDYVEYYYLPGIETYYYVPTRQFIYLNNGRWIFVSSLPLRYRTYNLYTGYKVIINQPRPYLFFQSHKIKYAKFKGYNGKQVIIRNSNDPKYFVVKGHPKHSAAGKNKTVVVSKGNNKPQTQSNAKGGGKGKGKH